jgi:hypothetical protein
MVHEADGVFQGGGVMWNPSEYVNRNGRELAGVGTAPSSPPRSEPAAASVAAAASGRGAAS